MRQFGCLLVSALTVWIVGCGGGGPSTHKVTGKITIGGEVIEGVGVAFVPVDATKLTASGRTAADGTYILYTGVQGKEGAEAGKYKVVLTPPDDQSYMETAPEAFDPTTADSPIPDEWKNSSTSPKEVEVTDSDNVINIEA